MEIESSLVAAQNQLGLTPLVREPQKQADSQQQQAQRQNTELPRQQVVARQNNPAAFAEADKYRQQQSSQDVSDPRARRAIDTYQNLANSQQRSEIQSMLGIDTYA